MLNEEYIENCIKDCLNSNNQLSEEKFLNLFSGLDDDEQQEVFQIMLKNNWSLASSEEKLEAPEYTKQSDQVNLSSISKLNNLSNEELCVLYQNGNQTALAALITKNRGFIYQIAHNLHKQYYSSDLDLDDEFSEGELGIITAAQKFDYTSGYKFLTYAWWWIIQAIIRAEINYGYSVRLPVHAFEAITKINKIYESNQQLSIKEITEIYNNKVPDTKVLTPKQVRYKRHPKKFTKKMNELLIDAESFSYIFETPLSTDDNDIVNKVKTAMLIIQKDYENRGFTPFRMRPVPLFAYGYLSLDYDTQKNIENDYPGTVKLVDSRTNVCELNLKEIWSKTYYQFYSFPKFKYLLYTGSPDLKFNSSYDITPAMAVDIFFNKNDKEVFESYLSAIKKVVYSSINKMKYYSLNEIIDEMSKTLKISKYKISGSVDVILAGMDSYSKNYSERFTSKPYKTRVVNSGEQIYLFFNTTNDFFEWLQNGYESILHNTKENHLYVVNDVNKNSCKETTMLLGILEAIGVLKFKCLGGSNSQLYIYVNETKNMKMVCQKPEIYHNKLLEQVEYRHKESVKMLTYLFENNFDSDQIWELLENYFLGIIPPELNSKKNVDSILNERTNNKTKDTVC